MSNKISIPYIRVNQRGETFFITKMSVGFLKNHVGLHFRDPYLSNQPKEYLDKYEDYLSRIEKKSIQLATDNIEGVQRRLQIHRIEGIKKYIEEKVNNFLPNSILISADVSKEENFDDDYFEYERNEIGNFIFSNDVRFSVIDGQHRLAGLFLTKTVDLEEFEIPVVLLFNVSLPTAAKLFADINGKQKPVSKSLIYDLYQYVDDEDVENIKVFNKICQQLYTDKKSPLFRQIKMLGTGSGAISQSFFIDMAIKNVPKPLKESHTQEIYNQLFFYFKSIQKAFEEYWPVPLNFNDIREVDEHSKKVLVENKSQLAKTNGFGALMKAFPHVYNLSEGKYEGYLKIVLPLKGKINWNRDELGQMGGGAEMQKYLYGKLMEYLTNN